MTTQVMQERGVSRAQAMGTASGILMLTFFGAYWGIFSAIFLGGAVQVVTFVLVGAVTLGCGGIGGMLLHEARSLPKQQSTKNDAIERHFWSGFGIVVGLEVALIALASVLLSIVQEGPYIAPATALIVGIHFFPLARLFRVSLYWLTGALLSVLALVALVALLAGWSWRGASPYGWSLVVGIGATPVLWATVMALAAREWQHIRQMKRGVS